MSADPSGLQPAAAIVVFMALYSGVSPCSDQAGAACCPARSVQRGTPASAGLSRLPADPVGHAQARPSIISDLLGSSPRPVGHRNPGASGALTRLLRRDSVRHMSVTTATQRLAAAHH